MAGESKSDFYMIPQLISDFLVKLKVFTSAVLGQIKSIPETDVYRYELVGNMEWVFREFVKIPFGSLPENYLGTEYDELFAIVKSGENKFAAGDSTESYAKVSPVELVEWMHAVATSAQKLYLSVSAKLAAQRVPPGTPVLIDQRITPVLPVSPVEPVEPEISARPVEFVPTMAVDTGVGINATVPNNGQNELTDNRLSLFSLVGIAGLVGFLGYYITGRGVDWWKRVQKTH